MKGKYIALAAAIMMSLSTFAQKDELKALKKIYDKDVPTAKDLETYKENIAKLETLAVTEGDKIYTNYYKSVLPMLELTVLGKNATPAQYMSLMKPSTIESMANAMNATVDYEKKTGKKVYTKDIEESVAEMKPMLFNAVLQLDKAKQYKMAAELLHSIYLLDKTDGEKLYYAANYAMTAQDYVLAQSYYEELVKSNWTGEGTVFWAKNAATGVEETYPSKQKRTEAIGMGVASEPRDEKVPSKRGEILKDLTQLYIQNGKTEEAKKMIATARAANPNDESLILAEANLYLETKDYATYKKLVDEALAKNPNNADLFYNLGVISYTNNNYPEAEKYYQSALRVNPNHVNANMNYAILKLAPEKKIVEDMNKLGTTPADNKKYDALKKQRDDLYRSAIPNLEKVVELDPKNEDAANTLLSLYKALEMTDKAKALKAKMNN